ncbi:hypothetical protein [Wolbachia endosymbiont of Mansonella perstans]|uniref:hypothetical protein n=1 Tax=Wolbachia endosymbiont of Mansonella perstans TaxID=229526 RepID=UPI001CE0D62C|nr:hypothetical protein [Wolbachia endosymbiont of Mansonella perstans]
MLIGFTASKLRTALVDAQILDEEKYSKSIIATVKDISNKGSYRQFLLFVEKPLSLSQCPDTWTQKKIHRFQRHTLTTKLFLPKIPPSEYAYDFTRIAYCQKISATGFATSKVALHKKAKARKFQEYIESCRQYIYEDLKLNIKKPHADIISALLIGK